MWSLDVRNDQVDQQIVEIDWIYLLFFFPPLSISAEVVWGAVINVGADSTAVSKYLDMHTVSGFRSIINPSFALWQLNFPVRKVEKKTKLYSEKFEHGCIHGITSL